MPLSGGYYYPDVYNAERPHCSGSVSGSQHSGSHHSGSDKKHKKK